MNNDLISRSALKEEFAKHEDRKGYLIGDWEDIIDNAPTIDTQTELIVARSQGYECGFAEGYEEGFAKDKERPTGHWESVGFVNMKYAWCRCSNCHKTTKIYKDSSNDFCCIADIRKKAIACLYCGANMRGEEE